MTQRHEQRQEKGTALVLRAVDYGESDRVITLLTREHGRVSAMARAARKSKRRFAGALEGFALIQVDMTQGRGALARLDAARVTRVFPRLLASLSALDAAGALMRLARDLLPERAPEPEVFDCLIDALELLDAGAEPRVVRLCCEARMLALAGFAPLLHACVACGREPAPERLALFDVMRGGIVCRACGGGSERMPGRVRALLQAAMDGASLQDTTDGVARLDTPPLAADVDALPHTGLLPADAVPRSVRPAALPDAVVREADRLLSLFVAQVLQREHKLHR